MTEAEYTRYLTDLINNARDYQERIAYQLLYDAFTDPNQPLGDTDLSEGFNPSDTSDGYVEFHPDAEKRAFLKQAGKYGPGLQHEADCEITQYEMPASENPRYDTDGKRGPYAYIAIKVKSKEFGLCYAREHIEVGEFAGSRLPRWLNNLGVPNGGPPKYGHRPADVVGRTCGVEIGDPRKNKDGELAFTGRLLDVFGA